MEIIDSSLYPYLAPIAMVLGTYCLILCIIRLGRIIFPHTKFRFNATNMPQHVNLPVTGRYVINVVFPAMTFITGISHFAARFAITESASGKTCAYHPLGRSLTAVRRTDLQGNMSFPLGSFKCTTAGQHTVICLNADKVRENFKLEIAPYVSPLKFVPLIIATIATAFLAIGGFLMTMLLWIG